MTQNYSADVVIIGAGIAAIKASLELTKAGITNTILEARDRLGGRLCTEKLASGVPVDLGASWFHDCYDNPLLKKYWTSKKIDFVYDDGAITFYNEDGPISANEHLMPLYAEVQCYLKHLYEKLPREHDISMKEAIYNYIKEKRYTLTEYQIRHLPQIVRFLEMWVGSSWEILSARCIATDGHKGRDAMVLNGYATVFNYELGEIVEAAGASDVNELLRGENPIVSIHNNNVVYKIEWDNKRKLVNVYSKEGAGKINKFTAKYVIFTAPLSILKLRDPKQVGAIEWSPQLPKKILSSLENISFSNLGKVFFEFPEVFWSLDNDRFVSIPNVDEDYFKACLSDPENVTTYKFDIKREDLQIKDSDPVPNGLDYTILFLNIARSIGKPVILALTSSPLTQYVERKDPATVFQVFKPVFARITGLPESSIPTPKEIKTSKWSVDPFARGSYTGISIGDDFDTLYNQLVDPVDIFDGSKRVRFAGEGIIDDGNGCAHAAWNTGLREASYIIKQVKKSKL